MNTIERRRYARVRLNLPAGILVKDLGDKFFVGNIINIGAGGAGILINTYLPGNTNLSMTFELQEGFRFESIGCKVIRSSESNDKFFSGLHFLEIDPAARERLDWYIKSVIFFKKIELFKCLTDEECWFIRKISTETNFQAGQKIFAEGAEGDAFYIIHSGKVDIIKGTDTAFKESLATLKEGDFFGEMALLDNSKRSASAMALTSVRLFMVSGKHFVEVLDNNEPLAVKMLWVFVKTLSQRLREAGEKMTDNFFTKFKR